MQVSDDVNWYQLILGGFVAVLTWIGKSVHKKANNAVSRAELRAFVAEQKAERMRLHGETTRALNRVHDRVDELYQLLNKG
jgi:hypothetical protein